METTRRYRLLGSKEERCTAQIQRNRSNPYTFDWYFEEFMLAIYIPNPKQKMQVETNALNCMVYISCLKAPLEDIDEAAGKMLKKSTAQPMEKLRQLGYAIAGRISDSCFKNGEKKLEFVFDQLKSQIINKTEDEDVMAFIKDCLHCSRKVGKRRTPEISKEDNQKFLDLTGILEENVKKLLDPRFSEYQVLSLIYGLFGERIHTLGEASEALKIPIGKIGAIFYNAKISFLKIQNNTCPKDIFLQLADLEKYKRYVYKEE